MGQRVSKIQAGIAADADGFHRLNHLLGNTGNACHQLDRRTGLEATAQGPLLIDDRINASALRIHYYHRASMMTQGVDGGATNIQVLTDGAVPGNVLGNFITHAFIDRALTSNRSGPRCFRTTTRFFVCATMTGIEPAHLSREFTFA